MQIELTIEEIKNIYSALGIAKEDYEHRLSEVPDFFSEEDKAEMREYFKKCHQLEKKLSLIIYRRSGLNPQ